MRAKLDHPNSADNHSANSAALGCSRETVERNGPLFASFNFFSMKSSYPIVLEERRLSEFTFFVCSNFMVPN